MKRFGNTILAAMLLVAFASPAFSAQHIVNQTDTTFDPDDILVEAGDEVQWIWSSGSHTVTSGIGPMDPLVGNYFDDPLDSGNTTFSYTFTTEGAIPYFCRPHFGLGMVGLVRVEPRVSTENSTWGQVKLLFR